MRSFEVYMVLTSFAMNKLTLCCFFMILCISQLAQAQGEWQIGLNAAPLTRQIFNISNQPLAANPYVFILEYQRAPLGGRLGIGLNNTYDHQMADAIEGTPEIITTNNAMNFRLGVVKYRPLAEKWQLKYGLDFYYWNTHAEVRTLTTDFFGKEYQASAKTISNELGLSPFLFLQWNVSPRLSLATELLGSVGFTNNLIQESNEQFPEFDDTDESNTIKYNLMPPTALYLIYRW
ncbi:MAG: hypothetical protein RLZZ262_1045 [Bacteroidota bacterium]|jgi:hypothetical protein